MNKVGGLTAAFALLATIVGAAIALLSHRLAPADVSLAVRLDGLITVVTVLVGAVWAIKTRPASLTVQDDDYHEKLQATRAPYALIVAFLAMLAAAFAGQFHGHAGFAFLLTAFALCFATTLTALLTDLDVAMPPFLLMLVFMTESAVVFAVTSAN